MKFMDMGVCERFKELRLKSGHSQHEFAKKLGIGQSNIAKIETGKTKPTLEILENVMKIIPNANISWLVLGTDEMFSDEKKSTKQDNEIFEKTDSEIIRELELENARLKGQVDLLLDDKKRLEAKCEAFIIRLSQTGQKKDPPPKKKETAKKLETQKI